MEKSSMKDFTVKELADILEVSKTTVRKTIQRENIAFDYMKNNKQYYSAEKAKSIIVATKEDFDFSTLDFEFANSQTDLENKGANLKTEGANSQTESENLKTETANLKTQEIELLKDTIDIIKKQLEEKDKQLAVKDKQIEDLAERLKEAMELTKGQQYIAAADKTTQLLEAEAEQSEKQNIVVVESDPEEPLQKKGFWQRLFK
jgi:uncharacterized protein YjcR